MDMKYARNDSVLRGEDLRTDVNYYKSSTVSKERCCDYCQESYKRYVDEIDYIQKIGSKTFEFCSYNCRSKFKKEHKKEIEKHDINNKLDAYEKNVERQRRNYKAKKENIVRKDRVSYSNYVCYVDDVKYDSMQIASINVFGKPKLIGSTRYRLKKDEFDWCGHHIKVVENDEISK